MGTYCEWIIGEKTYSCLATYPPPPVERMTEGMAIMGQMSSDWAPPESPRALLDRIPLAIPTSAALYAVPHMRGVFKYDKARFAGMPVMEWNQFMEMGRQAATGEWKPSPGIPQVPIEMPRLEVLPPAQIEEICTTHEVRPPPGLQLQMLPPPPPRTPPLPLAIANKRVVVLSDEERVQRKADLEQRLCADPHGAAALAQDIIDSDTLDGREICVTERMVAFTFLTASRLSRLRAGEGATFLTHQY